MAVVGVLAILVGGRASASAAIRSFPVRGQIALRPVLLSDGVAWAETRAGGTTWIRRALYGQPATTLAVLRSSRPGRRVLPDAIDASGNDVIVAIQEAGPRTPDPFVAEDLYLEQVIAWDVAGRRQDIAGCIPPQRVRPQLIASQLLAGDGVVSYRLRECAADRKNLITVRDLATGETFRPFPVYYNVVAAAGDLLDVGRYAGEPEQPQPAVVDARTGKERYPIRVHGNAYALQADGRLAFSRDTKDRRRSRLFTLAGDGRTVAPVRESRGNIVALAFVGNRIAYEAGFGIWLTDPAGRARRITGVKRFFGDLSARSVAWVGPTCRGSAVFVAGVARAAPQPRRRSCPLLFDRVPRVSRVYTVRGRFRCTGYADLCAGSARMTVDVGGRRLVVAHGRTGVELEGFGELALPLNLAGRRLLRARGRLLVTLTVRAAALDGTIETRSRRFVLLPR